jgi:MFS family permease
MGIRKLSFLLLIVPILLAGTVSAHCPLCTIGAGAAAAGAAWLGVSKVVIGLLMGAFAMSMGMWFARWADKKKRIIPFQRTLIITVVFLTTVLPLLPIFSAIGPLYIPFIGAYGTTYAVNYSLASSFLGGIITFVSPGLNKKIREKRNGKGIPFQGILLTFILLAIASLIIQFTI